MVNLPTHITGVIVVISVGFYVAALCYLVIIPIIDGVIGRCWPKHLDLPAIFENGGIVLAIFGFSNQDTVTAAIGVGLVLLGAVLGAGRRPDLHPLLQAPVAFLGIVCLGTLGEYMFLVS